MNRERLGEDAIKINTRDRLLRAWENSMELVLDFQTYAKEIKDHEKVAHLFAQFAEDEAMHARELHGLLRDCQDEYLNR
jgi:rubrerythrin